MIVSCWVLCFRAGKLVLNTYDELVNNKWEKKTIIFFESFVFSHLIRYWPNVCSCSICCDKDFLNHRMLNILYSRRLKENKNMIKIFRMKNPLKALILHFPICTFFQFILRKIDSKLIKHCYLLLYFLNYLLSVFPPPVFRKLHDTNTSRIIVKSIINMNSNYGIISNTLYSKVSYLCPCIVTPPWWLRSINSNIKESFWSNFWFWNCLSFSID